MSILYDMAVQSQSFYSMRKFREPKRKNKKTDDSYKLMKDDLGYGKYIKYKFDRVYNHSLLISGESGISGKTTAANTIIEQELKRGSYVFVITPKSGDYPYRKRVPAKEYDLDKYSPNNFKIYIGNLTKIDWGSFFIHSGRKDPGVGLTRLYSLVKKEDEITFESLRSAIDDKNCDYDKRSKITLLEVLEHVEESGVVTEDPDEGYSLSNDLNSEDKYFVFNTEANLDFYGIPQSHVAEMLIKFKGDLAEKIKRNYNLSINMPDVIEEKLKNEGMENSDLKVWWDWFKVPFIFVIDEAGDSQYGLSKVSYAKSIERLFSVGRGFNIFKIVITQKINMLPGVIMSNVSSRLYGSTPSGADRDFISATTDRTRGSVNMFFDSGVKHGDFLYKTPFLSRAKEVHIYEAENYDYIN